jgi:hypothetical protein
MRDGSLALMGGLGSFVEADETHFGKTVEQPTQTTRGTPFVMKHRFGPFGKRAIVALVERGGSVRWFHVDRATKQNVATIVTENVSHEAHLRTDESQLYTDIGAHFASLKRCAIRLKSTSGMTRTRIPSKATFRS